MKLRCSVESSIEFPVAVKEVVRSWGRRSAGLRPAETSAIDHAANSATPRLVAHVSAAHRAALRRVGLACRAIGDRRRSHAETFSLRPSTLDPFSLRAFTLIELLTVLAIVGILAALVAPVIIHLAKPDVTEAATRQMLDDCARARQLAISRRSTVYMVFIPTNFWGSAVNSTPWSKLANSWPPSTGMTNSGIIAQMFGAQMTGYEMVGLRGVGDQPGNPQSRDLQKLKTLPNGAFIAPIKFTLPPYTTAANGSVTTVPLVVQTNYPMWGFLTTNTIPFPTVDVLTNSAYVNQLNSGFGFVLPYIAFNYLGQLTPGDAAGSVLPYDEYIPLAYGKVLQSRDPNSKAYTKGLPTVTEIPPGGSTNISYNLIHIDRVTGRARLEHQNAL